MATNAIFNCGLTPKVTAEQIFRQVDPHSWACYGSDNNVHNTSPNLAEISSYRGYIKSSKHTIMMLYE